MKEGGNCYITEVIERYNRAGGRVGKGQELKSIEDIGTLIENMKNKPLEAITMAMDNVFSISTDSSNYFVTNVLYAELTRKLGSGELCGSRHLKMVFPKHGLKKAQQGKKGNKTIHSVLSVGNAGSEISAFDICCDRTIQPKLYPKTPKMKGDAKHRQQFSL